MEKQIQIEGLLEVTVEHREFLKEFYKWLDDNNWTFFGYTKEVDED